MAEKLTHKNWQNKFKRFVKQCWNKCAHVLCTADNIYLTTEDIQLLPMNAGTFDNIDLNAYKNTNIKWNFTGMGKCRGTIASPALPTLPSTSSHLSSLINTTKIAIQICYISAYFLVPFYCANSTCHLQRPTSNLYLLLFFFSSSIDFFIYSRPL